MIPARHTPLRRHLAAGAALLAAVALAAWYRADAGGPAPAAGALAPEIETAVFALG